MSLWDDYKDDYYPTLDDRLGSATWRTADGRVLQVATEMEPSHARNVLAYLERNLVTPSRVRNSVLGQALAKRGEQ